MDIIQADKSIWSNWWTSENGLDWYIPEEASIFEQLWHIISVDNISEFKRYYIPRYFDNFRSIV